MTMRELTPPMADCCACLVADTEAQLTTLQTMAARTGFGLTCVGLDAWRARGAGDPSVTFFFFHYRVHETDLAAALAEIRGQDDLNLRFSPAIAVVGECTEQDVLRFIELGFDDIVVLPEAPRILRRRFASQLNANITYFETPTYFGPDRRRAVHDPTAATRRGHGPSEHTRYQIRRSPRDGIRVLRREIVLSGAPPIPVTSLAPAYGLP